LLPSGRLGSGLLSRLTWRLLWLLGGCPHLLLLWGLLAHLGLLAQLLWRLANLLLCGLCCLLSRLTRLLLWGLLAHLRLWRLLAPLLGVLLSRLLLLKLLWRNGLLWLALLGRRLLTGSGWLVCAFVGRVVSLVRCHTDSVGGHLRWWTDGGTVRSTVK